MNYSIPDNPRGRHTPVNKVEHSSPATIVNIEDTKPSPQESLAAEPEAIIESVPKKEEPVVNDGPSVTSEPAPVQNNISEKIENFDKAMDQAPAQVTEENLNWARHDLLGEQFFEQLTQMPAKKPSKVPLALAHIALKEELAEEKSKIIEFRDLMIGARDSVAVVRQENVLYKQQNDELRAMLTEANEYILQLESAEKITPLASSEDDSKLRELSKENGHLKDRIRELVSVKNSMSSALEQYESSTPAPAESSVAIVDNSEELENLRKQIGYLSDQKRELIASKNALAKALEASESKPAVEVHVDAEAVSSGKEDELTKEIGYLKDRIRELVSVKNSMSSALEQYESATPAPAESSVSVVDNSEELENLKKQIGYLSDQKRELIASKNALAKALEASESKPVVEVHVDAEAVSSGKEDELTKEIGYLKDRIRELVSVKNSMSSALEQYESSTPASVESPVTVVDNSEELENLKKQIGYLSDQKRELIASKNALAKALEASESKSAVEVHVDAEAVSSGKEDELTKEIGYLKDRIRELVSVKNSMSSALEQYESATPAPAESSVSVVDNSEELENLKKQIGYLSDQKRELIASKNALAKALEASESKPAVEVHVDADAISSGKEDELTKEIGYLKDRIRELVSVKNSMASALEQYESSTPAPAESSVTVVDNSEELENLKKQIGYLSNQKRELIASKNALAKALEAVEAKL